MTEEAQSKIVATAELPRQFVVFAIPCYNHHVAMEFFQSCMETMLLLNEHKISCAFRTVCGDQFIARARNSLTMDFLTKFPLATDLFWIDDDVGFPAKKVIDFLNRPEAVVAGVYPKKQDEPHWPATFEVDNGQFVRNADGLYSAILAPGGFMRIKRYFVEELVKGRRLYQDDALQGDGSKAIRYNLFEAGLLPHWENWSGEDYDLCVKIRELGEKIWVDTDITFCHRGQKRYEGNMEAFMRINAEVIEKNVAASWEQFEAEKAKEPA